MRWFKNLTIELKLVLGISIIIILLGIVGGMGVIGSGKIQKELDEALKVRLPALDYIIESDRDLQQLLVAERSMIFSDVQSEVFKELVTVYEEKFKQSQQRIQELAALPLGPEEMEIIGRYKKARQEWEKLSRQIVKGRQEDTPEGRRLAIDLSLNQAKQAFENMRNHLDQLQNINLDIAKKSRQAAEKIYRTTLIPVVILTAGAILIVIILLGYMRSSISRPIKELVVRTRELGEGRADLTKRLKVKSRDELGILADLFNKWIDRIQGIILQVKSGSSQMLNSIEDIAQGSQELATRSNQQAVSITETSTTLEEFTSIVKLNSENAHEANSRIIAFNNEVQDKRELIQNVTATMSEIEGSSKQIGKIMNVINDISFQTNLLALNAAVEAARAGDAARGFAVVAAEVRNLAQKTAESAKTIQEIVTANLTSTERGMELVFKTEEFFQSILKVLNELSQIIKGIEEGSREQSTGMEQISQTVSQLDTVINQNAQLVTNFAQTGKKMNANAQQLQSLVEQFQTEAETKISKDTKTPTPPVTKPPKGPRDTPEKSKKIETPTAAKTFKTTTTTATTTATKTTKTPPPQKEGKPKEEDDFFNIEEGEFEEF